MQRLATLSITFLLLLGHPGAQALSISQGALPNKRLFAIVFPEDLSFYARHDRINSVSLQRYQSGPYLVTEMVVDVSSSDVLLRIYHTELMNFTTAQERAPEEVPTRVKPDVPNSVQKLIDRGRSSAEQAKTGGMVVKDYPTSTHAKTAEYRITEKAELELLYDRFINAFTGEESPADENDESATRISLAGTVFRVN